MKDSLKIGLGIIIGVLGSAACCIGAFLLVSTIILAPTPVVTPTEAFSATFTPTPPTAIATPTPLHTGETWVADNLAITVLEHEVASCYTSEYGSEICPPEGAAFLWVHLLRENRGSSSDLPIYSCFWVSLLYRGNELRPSWDGDYHVGRPSWSGGGCAQLYPGKRDEGWVCFEVPAGINLGEAILRVESYEGPKFEQQWRLTD